MTIIPATHNAYPNIYHNTNMYPNMLPNFSSIIPVPIISASPFIGDKFEPVEAGTNSSHVVLVVDESGSMDHLRAATISSINEFILSQKNDAIKNKIDTYISVYTFDGGSVRKIINKANSLSLPSVNEDNYKPNGMTNLNDAFGAVMAEINSELVETTPEKRQSVIITVMTDGMENASRTFTIQDVNVMMSKCKDKKWAFMFLGANIDAFSAGSAYGFTKNNTMQYAASSVGINHTLGAATRMTNSLKYTRAYESSATMDAAYSAHGFTEEERNKSSGDSK